MSQSHSLYQPNSPWPHLGGVINDNARDVSYATTLASNYALFFTDPCNGSFVTSPIIDAFGTIYLSTRNVMYAINPDQSIKWSFAYDPTGTTLSQNYYSNPVVASDGNVYICAAYNTHQSCLLLIPPNASGNVTPYVFSSPNGLPFGVGYYSSPCINETNTLFVGGYDRLRAFDISTQSFIWSGKYYHTYNPGISATTENPKTSPAIGLDGTIYIGSVGISNDVFFGKNSIWTLLRAYDPVQTTGNTNVSPKWTSVQMTFPGGSPTIGADGTIYIVGYTTLYAYAPTNATTTPVSPIWTIPNLGYTIKSNPILGKKENILYVVNNEFISAMSPSDGSTYATISGDFITVPCVGTHPTNGDDILYVGVQDRFGFSFSGKDIVFTNEFIVLNTLGNVFYIPAEGGIFRSTDYGNTWNTFNTYPYIGQIALNTSGNVIALAQLIDDLSGTSIPGHLYISTDSGTTWSSGYSAPALSGWNSVAMNALGNQIVAAEVNGHMYISTNYGVTWNILGTPSANWLWVICNHTGVLIYAIATPNPSVQVTVAYPILYKSSNGGTTWNQVPNPTGTTAGGWQLVICDASGDNLASIYNTSIYTSSDAGLTWLLTSAPRDASWSCIDITNDGTSIVASQFNGYIYQSVDFGVTWKMTSAPNGNWYSVANNADGTVLASLIRIPGPTFLLSTYYIYSSFDSGETWSPSNSDFNKIQAYSYNHTTTTFTQIVSHTINNNYYTGNTTYGNGYSLDVSGLLYSANQSNLYISYVLEPPTITNITTDVGSMSVTVSDGSGSVSDVPVLSYDIYYSPVNDASAVSMETFPASAPQPYTITGLVGGTSYNVSVKAVGSLNTGATSSLPGTASNVVTSPAVVCFNKGTWILCSCSNDAGDTHTEYRKIETLRPGDRVPTYLHGTRRIQHIGCGTYRNNPTWNEAMYRMRNTPTLGDLLVTGGHALLVDKLTGDQLLEYKIRQVWETGAPLKIDDKYLLLAAMDDRFEKINDDNLYTYYHMALENDGDDDQRYGIWAHGLLTETISVNQYKRLLDK